MKNLTLIALTLASLTTFGQSRYGGGLKLKELGIGLGTFWPAMDYYNDRTGYEFNQGLSGQVFGQLSLSSIIGLRLGVGYNYIDGTQSVTSEWDEETKLGLMPFTGELLINYSTGGNRSSKFSKSAFSPNFYFGIGTGYNLLFITYETPEILLNGEPSGGKQKLNGSTFTYHPLIGIQIPVGPMAIGIEGQYVFGSYSQAFLANSGSESVETVSINGPKALLTLAYQLETKSRYGRRSSVGKRRGYHSKRYRKGGLFSRRRRPRRR